MREIVSYDLISSDNYDWFIKSVDSGIEDGYQPLGAAFINKEGKTQMYYQTMVKYA